MYSIRCRTTNTMIYSWNENIPPDLTLLWKIRQRSEWKALCFSCHSLCVFQLVASIMFISFGVVAAFCCAIVDGVFAARHIVSTSNKHSE